MAVSNTPRLINKEFEAPKQNREKWLIQTLHLFQQEMVSNGTPFGRCVMSKYKRQCKTSIFSNTFSEGSGVIL